MVCLGRRLSWIVVTRTVRDPLVSSSWLQHKVRVDQAFENVIDQGLFFGELKERLKVKVKRLYLNEGNT